MIFLVLLGLILLFVKPVIGLIYISVILFAITIGLIAKEEKAKKNKKK